MPACVYHCTAASVSFLNEPDNVKASDEEGDEWWRRCREMKMRMSDEADDDWSGEDDEWWRQWCVMNNYDDE